MKAIFWASEATRPIGAPELFRTRCGALQLLRKVPSRADSALRRRRRRRAETSALSDFELDDLGLHRPDVRADPFAIMRSPGDADAAR